MVIKRLEDIEREKRENFKNQIAKDITDVTNKIFEKPKSRKTILGKILNILIYILVGIIILNLILGNIWLLKFLIKDLFLKWTASLNRISKEY